MSNWQSLRQAVVGRGPSGLRRCGTFTSLFVLCLPGLLGHTRAGFGYTNRSIGAPIGPGTIPPSSYQSGLVETPNPVDSGGNQLVTGNVRGGKHFRGTVPYRSSTSFSGQLGSTSLDSFLRFSAAPRELGPSSHGYSAFYSPTGTVTTIRPGHSRIFVPAGPHTAGGDARYRAEQPVDILDLAETPTPRLSKSESRSALETSWGHALWLRRGPLSRTPEDRQDAISDELGEPFADRRVSPYLDDAVTSADYRRPSEPLWRQLERARSDASKLEQAMRLGDDLSPQELDQRPRDTIDALDSRPLPRQATTSRQPSTVRDLSNGQALHWELWRLRSDRSATNVTEQMETYKPAERRLKLYSPSDRSDGLPAGPSIPVTELDRLFAPRVENLTQDRDAQETGDLPAVARVERTARAFETPSRYPDRSARGLDVPQPGRPQGSPGSTERSSRLSSQGDAAPDRVAALLERFRDTSGSQDRAITADDQSQCTNGPGSPNTLIGDRVAEKYEPVPSTAGDRFDRYMRTAQLYMEQGRYYRAADSFTLASVYRPRDPVVHVGKSHALFAAGEYVSSALYLAKAIELDPLLALRPSDLIELAGGPERFISRFNDLEACSQDNHAPQLQFLLAYVYYQMGQSQQARAAIEAAQKQLPSSAAVDILEATIAP